MREVSRASAGTLSASLGLWPTAHWPCAAPPSQPLPAEVCILALSCLFTSHLCINSCCFLATCWPTLSLQGLLSPIPHSRLTEWVLRLKKTQSDERQASPVLRELQRALELGYPVPGLPAGVTDDVSSGHPGAVSVDDGGAEAIEKLVRDVLGNGAGGLSHR